MGMNTAMCWKPQAALGLLPHNLVSFVTELHACFSAGKPPVDGDPVAVHSPVPGSGVRSQNKLDWRSATRSPSLEPGNEPQPGHHRLAVYPQKSTHEVRLQKKPDYAVRDLAIAVPHRVRMRSKSFP